MTGEVILTSPAGLTFATLHRGFLGRRDAYAFEAALVAERSAFRNGFMLVGDRWVKTPRLVAEFGDDKFSYPDTLPNDGWPPVVGAVRDDLQARLGATYNYAIANWYRHGRDFTGWHADKMELHNPASSIAMISVGHDRVFQFRNSGSRNISASVVLDHGSLLVMAWGSQIGYEHSLRPETFDCGHRISVTYRHVLPTETGCDCACHEATPVSGAPQGVR